jgi:hypothetical protein
MRNQGRKKTEQYNRCSKKKAENNNGRGNNHQETAQFSFCHIKEEAGKLYGKDQVYSTGKNTSF